MGWHSGPQKQSLKKLPFLATVNHQVSQFIMKMKRKDIKVGQIWDH